MLTTASKPTAGKTPVTLVIELSRVDIDMSQFDRFRPRVFPSAGLLQQQMGQCAIMPWPCMHRYGLAACYSLVLCCPRVASPLVYYNVTFGLSGFGWLAFCSLLEC